MRVAFLDTETTGLDFFENEIIQISICVINSDKIEKTCDYYIEAEKEVNSDATAINGYYKGKWKDDDIILFDKKFIANNIVSILKNVDLVVGHNVSFDRAFLFGFVRNYDIKMTDLPKYYFDTATIAQYFKFFTDSELKSTSLASCAEYFGIKGRNSDIHGSLEDTVILTKVFDALINKLKSENS